MALPDEIQSLATRTLAALHASHDYYTYTNRMWLYLPTVVQKGERFTFENPATGTSANEQVLVGHIQSYVDDYLTPATFQHFVSLFEDFFFGLLRLWLAAYPGSLSKKQVEMSAVLRAADKADVVLSVIDRELNDLKYERLADWFAYFARLTGLACPTAAEIERLAEIKASRDIVVHNNNIVNATYTAKSGAAARYADGERLEISEPYHRASWETINKVVRDLSAAAIAKGRGT